MNKKKITVVWKDEKVLLIGGFKVKLRLKMRKNKLEGFD